MLTRRLITSALFCSIVAVPVLGSAAPAHACIAVWQGTDTSPDLSEDFNASIGCDGVWARRTTSASDFIRGQYNDGGWQDSTLGWQWVQSGVLGEDKVIGNTVDGRRTRGVAQNYDQDVRYKY